MGYFSNSTECEIYEGQYCERCRNFQGEDAPACMVMQLHAEHNYGQHDKDSAAKARHDLLEQLIPHDKKTGQNLQCSMFNSIENDGKIVIHIDPGNALPMKIVHGIRAIERLVENCGDGMKVTRIETPNGHELY
ncbi:MAG: hypothetical protein KDA77_00305 [Planctomycetaceae bacterium]|nr:hypothetical protein [Planctomycetaceae bacterium]